MKKGTLKQLMSRMKGNNEITTRDHLLWTAIYYFSIKGYQRTSLADIASTCNIRKPTILYHFKSKEDLVLQSISMVRLFCRENLFVHLQEREKDPYARLQRFLKEVEKFYLKNFLGSFVINLITEFSISIDIQSAIRNYFLDWNKELIEYFSEFYEIEESRSLVTDVLMQLQGAALLHRVHRRSYYIKRVCDNFLKILSIVHQ